MFARATSSGKFLEVNVNLVNDLKARKLWDDVKEEILIKQGNISGIDDIPEEVKRVYKTSFEIAPEAFIEVAARAQKLIDQAMSRNMYLETRDVDEMVNIYMTAWEKGLKTTYYLHMKPRHTAEQSTTKVNKSEAITSGGGNFGFGHVANSPANGNGSNGNGHSTNGEAKKPIGFGQKN